MSVKKILALLLAAMMVFGMTSAMAEEPKILPSTAGETLEIPVTKTIWFYNEQGASVYEPNITYTFTISPATVDDGATVSDGTNTAVAKPGDMRAFGVAADATIAKSVKFDSAHQIVAGVTANGKGVTKGNSFTFTGTAITSDEDVIAPGIYRYLLTETSDVEPASVGIARPTAYDNTLILDVYVNKDGNVTGAVIHDPTDPSDDPTEPVDPNTDKTTGFGDGDEPTGGEPTPGSSDPAGQTATYSTTVPTDALTTEDTYTTYNFAVTKNTDGGMADASHNFPFAINITNSINGAAYSVWSDVTTADASLEYTGTGYAKFESAAADDFTPDLKKADFIYFKGVPSNQSSNLSVKITETNDTDDTYTVSATRDAADASFVAANSTGSTINADGTATAPKNAKVGTGVEDVKTGDANVFTYTNTLNDVSPTGVVLRFAPYFAMFAAGCALFLILATKRSKKEEE